MLIKTVPSLFKVRYVLQSRNDICCGFETELRGSFSTSIWKQTVEDATTCSEAVMRLSDSTVRESPSSLTLYSRLRLIESPALP